MSGRLCAYITDEQPEVPAVSGGRAAEDDKSSRAESAKKGRRG